MPELPEVETIRRQLVEELPFKIKKVEYSPVVKSILKEESKDFNPKGCEVNWISRKGKLLIFELEDGKYILSHFGMSGGWRISDKKIVEKHTHVQFTGVKKFLAYVDPRRFGNMYFYKEKKAKAYIDRLGVDISSPEFTTEYIYEILKRFPNKQLKPFLLDQAYFSGSGNYIACEICARAGIRPTRRCGKVTLKEAQKIKDATDSVINNSIENQGQTFSGGYADATGDKGQGVMNLVVFYQKQCGLCNKSKVKKIVLAQRGTYYCPKCQK